MARKKHKRKVTLAEPTYQNPTSWDMGAMGAANRVGLVEEDRPSAHDETGKPINPNGIRGVRRVDMLEVWVKRYIDQLRRDDAKDLPCLSVRQYNAAKALRLAFEQTMCSKSAWPDMERVQSSPKPDISALIRITAVSRFHQVNKLVAPQDREIIDHVLLSLGNEGLMDARSPASLRRRDGSRPYYGRNGEAGMAALQSALERLANAMGAMGSGRHAGRDQEGRSGDC